MESVPLKSVAGNLVNADIQLALRRGDIVICPFVEENLRSNSYDVTLGSAFFRQRCFPNTNGPRAMESDPVGSSSFFLHDPYTPSLQETSSTRSDPTIRELWHKHPVPMEPCNHGRWPGIAPDESVLWISPGETVLAHTHEVIGAVRGANMWLVGRSGWMREGISVAVGGGWGDTGYVNRWTMTITNTTASSVIPLVVGRRIAQAVFLTCGTPTEGTQYGQRPEDKYASPAARLPQPINAKSILKSWMPDQMLPKAFNDREAKAAEARRLKWLSERVLQQCVVSKES